MLMIFNVSSPAYANEIKTNLKNSDIHITKCYSIIITDDGVYINDVYYTQEQFSQLLDNAVLIDKTELRSNINNRKNNDISIQSATAALVAGTWWIPGIGEVVITAAGVIIISGIVIEVGSWLYEKIVDWFQTRAFNKSAEDAVNNCDENKRNHIMQPKHNWNKFKKDPKWSDIAPILIKVLKEGTETWEKNDQYIRTLVYKGETVVVRFIKDAEGLVKYISTAWCE